MKQWLIAAAAASVLSGSLLAQSGSARPTFDVASIQVSTRPNPGMRGGALRGNRYELRNATMLNLIAAAYNVQPERISGGPSWLEWNRFDIAALAPEGTPPERLREMLKALLAERFHLLVREDLATTTAMALKVNAQHKLREVPGPGGCQFQAVPVSNGVANQTVICAGLTMAQLAEQMPRAMPRYFPGGQQVVDRTGLSGFWEFQFTVTPPPLLQQAGPDAITLQAALATIGLTLEPQDISVPAIVVDTVTAEFTPNPADIDRRLPPPPAPRFEVAVLRPSPPDAQQPRAQLLPTGQVNISAGPLKRIIATAWNLPEPFIVGPRWLETARFDVTARAFAAPDPANNAQLDEDRIRLMLQALVVERFRMKYHMEDRPMPAFTLVADEPKMTKSDPAQRTRCFEGPPAGAAPTAKPQPFARQVTCQNISMQQFGELLPNIAAGYTRVAVLDRTGLQGGYDFTLNFSTIEQVRGPQADPGAVAAGTASDPTGALPLQDAMRRQLGIRLEEAKRPVPVLVIDSIDQQPADN